MVVTRRDVFELSAAGSRILVARGHAARVGELVASTIPAHRAAILSDSNVAPLYAAALRASLRALDPVVVTIPAGEVHKTRETWARVSDELLAHELGRDTVVIALGGGVVGDLAGFVAATYLRGVPFVQVPTSLVAMIDASIGGKVGVDTPTGKNLVGAFHPAALVVADPDTLTTLPAREHRAGLAEALKHGAIADAAYFERVAADGGRDTLPLVTRSIEIKSALVNEDPREAGARKLLNFGHTIGHAIEAESGFAINHGEAVAIGMVIEARIGEAIGATEPGTSAAIARALTAVGLPTSTILDPAALVARTRSDKKKRGGRVEYSLPAALGRFAAPATPVDDGAAVNGIRG